MFPACSYSEGLVKAGLPSLYDRRSQLCKELFSDIEKGDHKLSHLLPARPRRNYHLRSNRKFVVPEIVLSLVTVHSFYELFFIATFVIFIIFNFHI